MTFTNPIDGQEYPLASDFSSTALTFDITGRFVNDNAGTFTVGTQVIEFSTGEGRASRERAIIRVDSNPTEIDATKGIYRYTIISGERGLDSDNDTDASGSIKANVANQKLHPGGRMVAIVHSGAYYAELSETFAAGTTTINKEAGENIALNDSVSLHSDGKVYKYLSTTYPNFIGIADDAITSGVSGNITTFGGLSTGHSGLTIGAKQYAENTGAITETPSVTTVLIGKSQSATEIRVTLASDAVSSVSDADFEVFDDGDPTKKLKFEVSGNATEKDTTIATQSAEDETFLLPNGSGLGGTLSTVHEDYFGNGSDGALTIASGTTNIAPNVSKNYSSISITGGQLSLSSAGIAIIRCIGDCTIDGGLIDVSGAVDGGGVGGVAAVGASAGTETNAASESANSDIFSSNTTGSIGGKGDFELGGWSSTAASGGGGGSTIPLAGTASAQAVATSATPIVATATASAGATIMNYDNSVYIFPISSVGANGAGGGAAAYNGQGSGTMTTTGGTGGGGGSAIVLLVGGNLIITGTAIDTSGGTGTDGDSAISTGNYCGAAAGGGGGGGGSVYVLHKGTLTGSTTNIDASGGAGGSGVTPNSSGNYGVAASSGGAGAAGDKNIFQLLI